MATRNLPEEFTAMLTSLGLDGLSTALSEGEPYTSVRLNRSKGVTEDETGFGGSRVAWCDGGMYLDERPRFTFDPKLHQGCYYVQEASSMFHSYVVRQLVGTAAAPLCVLDSCAAPGGKTTAVIDSLPAGSLMVANEYVPSRAAVLRENLIKWGSPACVVTRGDTAAFRKLRDTFDIIIADVPCSGEGMMRKDPKAVGQWTPGLVDSCARLQWEIVESLWPLLRPGGYFIYSTCTFSRAEDEAIVERMAAELGAEQMPLPPMPGVVGGHFYPHLVRGEGLYMALLRKPGNEPARRPDLSKANLIQKSTGEEYELKGRTRIPSHALALRSDFRPDDRWPQVEVGRDDALRFLHRDALTLPAGTPRGQVLLTFGARPLGWVNNLGSRANNLLPKHLRILSDL